MPDVYRYFLAHDGKEYEASPSSVPLIKELIKNQILVNVKFQVRFSGGWLTYNKETGYFE